MILKNKKLLLLTSLLTLLPIPVFHILKQYYPVDALGNFPIFLPLSLLAAQWLCVALTALDKSNQKQHPKPMALVLWILPLISNVCSGIFFALLLGIEFSPVVWMMVPMGLLFAAIGNYLPKTRMNTTLGIKVRWAYTSEANWNATHRFAGKLWVAGGLIMAASGFLPEAVAIAAMLISILVLCAIPVWYSWRFYRKELAEGKVEKAAVSKIDRRITKVSLVLLAGLTVFVCVILFTGDLHYVFSETGFTIEADFYPDYSLSYDAIDSVEFRRENMAGTRVGGFGSFRLLMGFFRNEEFGNYSRYTYYDPGSCIILYTGGKPVVISGRDPAETESIYNWILKETADN